MIVVSAAFKQYSRYVLGVKGLERAGTWWAFHYIGYFMSPGWGLVAISWAVQEANNRVANPR
jgi:hypothetical protein